MPISSDLLRDYNADRICVDKGAICHAAESSMYFGRDGAVSVCCYSRDGAIGHYPEQTVDEIWSGALAKTMRSALRHNELPHGCQLCADQLHARNFSGILARQFDDNARTLPSSSLLTKVKSLFRPEQTPRQYPVQLEFELSNKCNLECAMCSGFFSSSIRSNRENLPALPQLYDSAFVQQLLPYIPHLKRAKFLGGEPFLIDVYYEIWEKLIELNPTCEISITTNATVFTEKVRRVLDKLNCQIIVSLDSIVKPTYESIRVNAIMEKTLANFEIFTEYNRRKKRGLSIANCPMGSNAEEIPGLVEFATERGARVFFNTVIYPRKHSIRSQPIARQRSLVKLYRDAAASHTPNSDIERDNWATVESFARQIEFWIEELEEKAAIPLPPVPQRCADLLASGEFPPAQRILLHDILQEAGRPQDEVLVQLTGGDPIQDVILYFQGMFNLGTILETEKLLPKTHFDRNQEALYIAHLRETLDTRQAQKLYNEVRRFPQVVLGMVGTASAARLAEMLDQHLATPRPEPVHNE